MTWRVFYSYSHEDQGLCERLTTYLAPLRHEGRISDWYDRKIEAGGQWEPEIFEKLESAHLILLLVSEHFLASDYCFGVELEKAFARLKNGDVKVVPILLKPCLWKASPFSELQLIPRNAKPIISWSSQEDAFYNVAEEIRDIVHQEPPFPSRRPGERDEPSAFASSLDLVRGQVRSYARQYEIIRQRMRPSDERTLRMEQIFKQMRSIATASYPLLDELANSPSPGERLCAVAILQHFANEEYLPLLVKIVGTEKPFVGYHAIVALHFAVRAIDPRVHPKLLTAIVDAQDALKTASVGFDTDRQKVLREAEQELRATISALAPPSPEDLRA